MSALFQIDLDFREYDRSYGPAVVDRASRIGMKRMGVTMLGLVLGGFEAGGVNPETGAPGFWPPRKTPDAVAEGGVKARAKAVKKAIREHRFASFEELALAGEKGEKAAARKLRAKTKKGIVRRIRVGGKVMFDTGRYFDSINASDVKSDADSYEVTVGTNVEYAKYHEQPGNEGDSIKYKATGRQAAFLRKLGFTVFKGTTITLPKRRVFVAPKPWQEKAGKVFEDEFTKELQRA